MSKKKSPGPRHLLISMTVSRGNRDTVVAHYLTFFVSVSRPIACWVVWSKRAS